MPPSTFNDEFQSMQCISCFADLRSLSMAQREAHYAHHLPGDLEDASKGSKTMPFVVDLILDPVRISNHSANSSNYNWKKPFTINENDVFWYAEQTTPPPSNFTPGLISVLRKGLSRGHTRGLIRKAALCCDQVVHINREVWDASWGCGYRNFLMACSGLITQTKQPLYFPLLDSPFPPSVRNLQKWIEAAWQEGYDIEGQNELKSLVQTRKWVGTSDLWVAFIFRGIPAELVDFDLVKQSQVKASELVINWVVNYFSPKDAEKPRNAFEFMEVSPITVTDKMPLILQHNGHSRTVVGYEIDKNGVTNLLVFDPSHKPTSDVRNAALAEYGLSSQQGSDILIDGTSGTLGTGLKRKRSGTHSFQNGKQQLSCSKNGPSQASTSYGGKERDLFAMVKKFRLNSKNLSKKEYQILYFPMTAPLTDYERMQRKEVRSSKIY